VRRFAPASLQAGGPKEIIFEFNQMPLYSCAGPGELAPKDHSEQRVYVVSNFGIPGKMRDIWFSLMTLKLNCTSDSMISVEHAVMRCSIVPSTLSCFYLATRCLPSDSVSFDNKSAAMSSES